MCVCIYAFKYICPIWTVQKNIDSNRDEDREKAFRLVFRYFVASYNIHVDLEIVVLISKRKCSIETTKQIEPEDKMAAYID